MILTYWKKSKAYNASGTLLFKTVNNYFYLRFFSVVHVYGQDNLIIGGQMAHKIGWDHTKNLVDSS